MPDPVFAPETLTDAWLVAAVSEYDAGPPPVLNGRATPPGYHEPRHHVRVVRRWDARAKVDRWAVFDAGFDLNTTGNWEFARSGSLATAGYLRRCRYPSARAALAHYFRWRSAVYEWLARTAKRRGDKVIARVPRDLLRRAPAGAKGAG